MSLPACPQCGTPVQSDWDWCHSCGFDPDGLRPVAAGMAPVTGPSPAFGPPPGTVPPQVTAGYTQGPYAVPRSPGYGLATGYGVVPAPPPKRHQAAKIVLGAVGGGLVLLLVLVLGVTFLGKKVDNSSSATKPSAWVTFTPPGGSFSASFPATPQASTQTAMSSDGIPVKLDVYTANTQTDGLTIAVADVPPGGTFSPQGAATGAAGSMGGTLTSSTTTTFGTYEAIDYEISVPAGKVQATAINAGTKIYLIQYAGEKVDPGVWERFRSSVTLTP